jgi:hypothetical protein
MHIHPRHVFENSYKTPFFIMPFLPKEYKCCLPYDNIVVEEEE